MTSTRAFIIHKIIHVDYMIAFDLKSYSGLIPVYIGYNDIVKLRSGHGSIIGITNNGILSANNYKIDIDGVDII